MKHHEFVVLEVARERERQMLEEGFTTDKDDDLVGSALADAAACYAADCRVFRSEIRYGRASEAYTAYIDLWPWSGKWWKPKDRRRNLIRAAALIIAEIERLDRKNSRKTDNSTASTP